MAISNGLADHQPVSVADAQLARVAEGGCDSHPHVQALLGTAGASNSRDLADCVHLLCSLHGRHPGFIALATQHSPADSPSLEWLAEAGEQFERERLYLVRLTSAVGPLPSTPGAAETESVLLAQRNAMEILARSERRGCALGAVCALIGDWPAIRRLLDRAAQRVGIDCPQSTLPAWESVAGALASIAGNPSSERALSFGTEQLLLQHRALFDLLEARAEARTDY